MTGRRRSFWIVKIQDRWLINGIHFRGHGFISHLHTRLICGYLQCHSESSSSESLGCLSPRKHGEWRKRFGGTRYRSSVHSDCLKAGLARLRRSCRPLSRYGQIMRLAGANLKSASQKTRIHSVDSVESDSPLWRGGPVHASGADLNIGGDTV